MSNFTCKWQSPSNIAIVKYWGKYGNQLPRNGSISLTLRDAVSVTELTLLGKSTDEPIEVDFYFEGESKPEFAPKSIKLLKQMASEYTWIKDYRIKISSSNTFPHSSGIASSASGMSALSICVLDMDAILQGNSLQFNEETRRKASYYARLGSGSASRSLFAQIGQWGSLPDYSSTSDEHAVSWSANTHEVFKTYHDDILIVSKGEKSVSSSAGHGLMDASVFASARYQQANQRLVDLFGVLKSGDVDQFGRIAEDDALTLHGLMMCSEPSFTLLAPKSIEIINEIRHYRAKTGVPVYFTIDAGPNIHMLYPDAYADQVATWRDDVLRPLCADGQILTDQVGDGPVKLA